jgi:hypothetical protein
MRSRLLKNFLLGFVGVVVIATLISVFTATNAAPRFYYSVTDLNPLDTATRHQPPHSGANCPHSHQ